MPYKSAMQNRTIALVVMGATNWPDVQKYILQIVEQVGAARPGMFIFIDMPLTPKPPYLRTDD